MIQQWRPEQFFTLLKTPELPNTVAALMFSRNSPEFRQLSCLPGLRSPLPGSDSMERNSPGDVMLSESTADGTPARGCGV
jgi:hypothetical protein